MVFVKAKCFTCGADFHIYIDHLIDGSGNRCPHCGSEMPRKGFKKLTDVLMMTEEINKDLRNSHTDRGLPLFQVELGNHCTI